MIMSRESKTIKSVTSKVVRLGEMQSIYFRLHGHTMIPTIFIVPSDSTDWPTLFHDAKLGSLLATMRSRYRKRSLSSETIEMLEAHGIVWEPLKRSWSGTVTTRMLAEMLSIYARIHGHTKIPNNFLSHPNQTIGQYICMVPRLVKA